MPPQPEHPGKDNAADNRHSAPPPSGAARINFDFLPSLTPDVHTYLQQVALAYLSGVRDLHPGIDRLPQLPSMLGIPGRMIIYLTPEQIARADAQSLDPEAKRLGTIFENSFAITDLGLVTKVEISASSLRVTYILTTDYCPAGSEFKAELGRAVVELFQYLQQQGMPLSDAQLIKGDQLWDESFVDDRLLGRIASVHRSLNLGCAPKRF